MSEPTFDDHINSMTGLSNERLGTISAVKGISDAARDELKAFMGAVTAMPGIGSQAADRMKEWRADGSVLSQFRTSQADEVREVATITLKAHHDAAVNHANRYEQELINDLLPKRASDPNQRILARDELRNILGAAKGQDLVRKVMDYVGKSPRADAELVSEWGESLFKGQGLDKEFDLVKSQAVTRWLARQDGSDRQQSTRKALQTYRASNPMGSIAAFRAAANMHLSRDDGLAPANLRVDGVSARGRKVK